MLSPELSTAATLITGAIAIVALIAAYGSFHFCMRVAEKERDYRQLLLAITQLDDNYHALYDSHKRLRSRVGMRELRERRKGEHNNDDSPDPAQPSRDTLEWKKQMRIKLATGEVKPR